VYVYGIRYSAGTQVSTTPDMGAIWLFLGLWRWKWRGGYVLLRIHSGGIEGVGGPVVGTGIFCVEGLSGVRVVDNSCVVGVERC
jgi:hypothetical protein